MHDIFLHNTCLRTRILNVLCSWTDNMHPGISSGIRTSNRCIAAIDVSFARVPWLVTSCDILFFLVAWWQSTVFCPLSIRNKCDGFTRMAMLSGLFLHFFASQLIPEEMKFAKYPSASGEDLHLKFQTRAWASEPIRVDVESVNGPTTGPGAWLSFKWNDLRTWGHSCRLHGLPHLYLDHPTPHSTLLRTALKVL